jgi:hypothetical protein
MLGGCSEETIWWISNKSSILNIGIAANRKIHGICNVRKNNVSIVFCKWLCSIIFRMYLSVLLFIWYLHIPVNTENESYNVNHHLVEIISLLTFNNCTELLLEERIWWISNKRSILNIYHMIWHMCATLIIECLYHIVPV